MEESTVKLITFFNLQMEGINLWLWDFFMVLLLKSAIKTELRGHHVW
jgi:hypothetical protein